MVHLAGNKADAASPTLALECCPLLLSIQDTSMEEEAYRCPPSHPRWTGPELASLLAGVDWAWTKTALFSLSLNLLSVSLSIIEELR